MSQACPTNDFTRFNKEEIEDSIPGRFARQVRRHAGRVAVKAGSELLTYAALNEAANRAAHAVLSRDAASQEPVAVLLGQGAPAIAAAVGVLKARQILVPLDPGTPGARLAHVLEDSQARLIVANRSSLALAHELAAGRLAVLDLDESDEAADTNPDVSVGPDDLAYVIYTSGSTGQPKGVVHNHRHLLHDCMKRTNTLHLCAEDRWTLLSSATSQTIKNIFAALFNGAALYPFDIKAEGLAALAGWLIGEEITVYYSSASVFRNFLDTLTGREEFPRLRLIRLGGETVSKRDVELYQSRFPRSCLFANMLSSNETGCISCGFIDKETIIAGETVPVGHAMEDMEVLLLDDAGRNVGFNRTGQIVVKSRYLAQGYWRRPDLTEAAFRPDPDGGTARLYYTGDLGRMQADGSLEYVGRKDFQVKIRGYRVEVAEVEAALLTLENIKQAVVVGREDVPGQARLVAYLIAVESAPPTAAGLHRFLAGRLPDYMVPSAFVMLDSFPVLPNGKVDRKALPAPDDERPRLEGAFVAPETPVEQELAGIWGEVLGVRRVGVQDPFLELGGNSLQAGRIVARVMRQFGIRLPVASLLQSTTVADMALAVVQSQAEAVGQADMERTLTELEGLSAEQVERLLAGESAAGEGEEP